MKTSSKQVLVIIVIILTIFWITGAALAQGPPSNPGPPGNTLGHLNCSTDQIAEYNGSEWVCADDLSEELQAQIDALSVALTQEISDRQAADATLQANIDAEAATRAAEDGTLQSNIDNEAIARANGDAGLQTTVDDHEARISDLENTSVGTVDWTNVTNIPPDIADGDDDTLGDIACSAGQLVKFNGGWTCADDLSDSALTAANNAQATADSALVSANNAQGLASDALAAANSLTGLLQHFSRTGDDIFITGANLHVVNGLNDTETTNELGNVIIGYNELRGSGDDRTGSHMLVVGQGNNYSSYGGIVVGQLNETSGIWSSVSGGQGNSASGAWSSVSGGLFNIASGEFAAVSGGFSNIASGDSSSISGGKDNTASGANSSISGGSQGSLSAPFDWKAGAIQYESFDHRIVISAANLHVVNGLNDTQTSNGQGNVIIGYNELRDGTLPPPFDQNDRTGSHMLVVGEQNNYSSYGGIVVGQLNETSGNFAAVSGGVGNTASGESAAVSGGQGNTASDFASSVSGGQGNTASGASAAVSGGLFNTATSDDFFDQGASVSGGMDNTATGHAASVSGGEGNTANCSTEFFSFNRACSVSGGLNRSVADAHDWAAGSLFEPQ